MGVVLQFRLPPPEFDIELPTELDLLSAVDFALRDLSDISRQTDLQAVREQALQCRDMLEAAYLAAAG
ncbi:hypothetical protein [Bosea sp. PAMC 26642]|uniref:hypothetical protein n=1 Tax=Bosea sp. (strain PAMC 26642) TaxID=1792307 RepID=UPI000770420C|nr:hypothetical protein [Bosea sp. PAMC 26642]AMJ62598.1 hypothetical protein AXW83_21915 [Bosea sp. PAMC 26642]